MSECFASMSQCAANVHSALTGKKRMTDQLEMELQIVASCRVGTGNQNQVLRLEHGSSGRAATALNHWSISLALGISF